MAAKPPLASDHWIRSARSHYNQGDDHHDDDDDDPIIGSLDDDDGNGEDDDQDGDDDHYGDVDHDDWSKDQAKWQDTHS